MNYIQILYLCILKQRIHTNWAKPNSCELHSNLVSLHSETTFSASDCILLKLWITFKSCIFAFWNNHRLVLPDNQLVVNYIQILYLCILKQQINTIVADYCSCELHSNLVSLHSETTGRSSKYPSYLLWITFKSCIFAFWNNVPNYISRPTAVVNYIQILYLCILKQHFIYYFLQFHSCELHSNLVSLHSETTIIPNKIWRA